LNNLAVHLRDKKQRMDCLREATQIWSMLKERGDNQYSPQLAGALINEASLMEGDESVPTAGRAVDLLRELYAYQPDRFAPNLARALYLKAECEFRVFVRASPELMRT
jgi:hypothetical protein